MKEIYVKPKFYIESFVMSQSVAAGCGAVPGGTSLGKPGHGDKSTCGWDMGNVVVWVDKDHGCSIPYPADGEFNGYCYNNPNGGTSIFGSY